MFREQLKTAVLMLFALTVLTGVVYPYLVTVAAQSFCHEQANGSLIIYKDKTVGSVLIGQPFTGPKYLWGRASATAPVPCNAASSSGSNLGPSNPALTDSVKARIAVLRAADPGNKAAIPVDLVTASASGLDPHISPAGAYYQAARIARARDIPETVVGDIIQKNTEERFLGILGEPIVNVLKVNLDLDSYRK